MPKIRGVKPDYWTDEDVIELSIPARLLFIGMWNYACDNGHLDDKPKQIKMRVLPTDDEDIDALLDELVQRARIVRKNGTITIPKFAQHQKPNKRWWTTCDLPWCKRPKGKQLEDQGSEAASENPAQPEGNGGQSWPTADVSGCDVSGCDGDGDTSRELTLAEAPRGDVERICTHLADRIEQNGAKRPAITKGWRDAARLMLDRDERTEHEIHGAIDWCQAHEFWRSNILSLPKLREKFDQLRLQAQRRGGGRQRADADMFDRMMQRAEQHEAAMRGDAQ